MKEIKKYIETYHSQYCLSRDYKIINNNLYIKPMFSEWFNKFELEDLRKFCLENNLEMWLNIEQTKKIDEYIKIKKKI